MLLLTFLHQVFLGIETIKRNKGNDWLAFAAEPFSVQITSKLLLKYSMINPYLKTFFQLLFASLWTRDRIDKIFPMNQVSVEMYSSESQQQ